MPYINCNEIEHYYEIQGEGEVIVFIHGMALDHRMWQEQVAYFSKNYCCLSYDMRGFGKSVPLDDQAYSLAEDLEQMLSLLGMEKVHIVGLSKGGNVATDYVVQFQERVQSLTLVDAHVNGHPIHEGYEHFKKALRKASLEGGDRAAKEVWSASEIFTPVMLHPTAGPRFRTMLEEFDPVFWRESSKEKSSGKLAYQCLQEINCPCLVIVGEKDIAHFRQVAESLAATLKNVRYEVMNGVGHMANMEDGEAFNRLFEGFLNGENFKI